MPIIAANDIFIIKCYTKRSFVKDLKERQKGKSLKKITINYFNFTYYILHIHIQIVIDKLMLLYFAADSAVVDESIALIYAIRNRLLSYYTPKGMYIFLQMFFV